MDSILNKIKNTVYWKFSFKAINDNETDLIRFFDIINEIEHSDKNHYIHLSKDGIEKLKKNRCCSYENPRIRIHIEITRDGYFSYYFSFKHENNEDEIKKLKLYGSLSEYTKFFKFLSKLINQEIYKKAEKIEVNFLLHSSKKIILLYEKGELTRDYKSLTGEIKEKKEYDLKSLSENSDSLAIDMLFIFLEKFEVETIKFREKFEGHQKEIWKDWAVA